MDISEVRAQVARNELLRLIKDIGLPLCLFGTVTEVSAPNASVRLDGDTESTVCSDMVGCSVDDRCIVANIKNMAVVIAAIGGTDTSDKADVDHEHAASDITSGSLPVARGGTGRTSLTSGQYLVGNGTSAVSLKTKAQVLSDIGAAASSHNHTAGDINSGTLGVARGGTGRGTFTAGSYLVGNGTIGLESKTPAEVLDDIGAAASSHEHAASDVTSGTLAIARIPTITVAKGGTGATDAAGARTNLGITPANIGAAPTNHTHDYLPLSGGTITGTLKRENADMDISAASLSAAKYSIIGFTDANDRYAAYLQALELTDGTVGFDVAARRYNSGNATNYARLKMDKSGNASVEFSHPAAWRSGLGLAPTVLYSSAAGIGTAVTLSASITGYPHIKVYYKDENGRYYGSQEFYGLVAGAIFHISAVEATANGSQKIRRTCYTVSSDGKTFTPSYGGYMVASTTATSGTNNTLTVKGTANGTNYLRIHRVEAYAF